MLLDQSNGSRPQQTSLVMRCREPLLLRKTICGRVSGHTWCPATQVERGEGWHAHVQAQWVSTSRFPSPTVVLCAGSVLLRCAPCVFQIMVSMFWHVGHHLAIRFLSSKGMQESSCPLKAPFLFPPFNFLNYYFEVVSGRSEYKYLCTIWPQFLLAWKVLICFSLITS